MSANVCADGATEDRQLAAARAARTGEDAFFVRMARLEPAVIERAAGRITRQGAELTFSTVDGQKIAFRTRHECPDMEISPDNCVIFSAIADIPSRHAFLVAAAYYEGADFRWIDDRTGRQTILPGIPDFAPMGGRFLTIDDRDHVYPGFMIWKLEHDGAVPIWEHRNYINQLDYSGTFVRWTDPSRIFLELDCEVVGEKARLRPSANRKFKLAATIETGPRGWYLSVGWPWH